MTFQPHKQCETCNGGGVALRKVWSDSQKKFVYRSSFCPRCDGSGKRHVCSIPNCVNCGHGKE